MEVAYTREKLIDVLEYFLKAHEGGKYRGRVSQMAVSGSHSLVVDYEDLLRGIPEVAPLISENPDFFLEAAREALLRVLSVEAPEYAEHARDYLRVRIRGYPERLPLRSIDASKLERLVSVNAMVVRTSQVKPLVIEAVYRCPAGHAIPVRITGRRLQPPDTCPVCEAELGEGGGKKGRLYRRSDFRLDQRASKFVDYQVIRLQELPEELPPGQLPHYVDVEVTGDIVDRVRPGDRVVVTGIVRAEPESEEARGRPAAALAIFDTRLEANYIEVVGKEPEELEITPEDEAAILRLARDPDAYGKLVRSFAPSISGYEDFKEAILLMLAGAPQITLPDGSTVRGNINVLLVGDPGTAKSELLKYAARAAPRGLYTTGRGSTAAGLTAAIVREKNGLMVLEAGAVVLADEGLAAIDEFDKMRPEDRAVLHEVMEQQTVSIAKGGIVATLNARTSILAAANPNLGRYDEEKYLYDNVNLPIPLLTRFDLIFVVRDVPQRERDVQLARHMLRARSEAQKEAPPLSFDMLRKYIAYSKRVEPKLTEEAMDVLVEFYADLRSRAPPEAIAITPRQLESLARLATARARLLLREHATREDAEAAVRLMKISLRGMGIDVESGEVDMGELYGYPVKERNRMKIAIETLRKLEDPKTGLIPARQLVQELSAKLEVDEEEAKKIVEKLWRAGYIYEHERGYYKRASA
ncbi:MAG: minichromosome maintenance protein MCM [Conexivisphaera sp.]